MKIEPGSQVKVHLQYGTVQTPTLILATNAYTSNLGLFKQRIIPVDSHSLVTAPLTDHQVKSLWKGREPISDLANLFLSFRLPADNRVFCGGRDASYYYGGSIDTGKGHPIYNVLVQSLRNHFPALSDIPVTHHWGGTVGMTLDAVPTVGVVGPHQNIFLN